MTSHAETREGAYYNVRDGIIGAARAGATRKSINQFEWDISADCENARHIVRYARPYVPGVPEIVPDRSRNYFIGDPEPIKLVQSKEITIRAGTWLHPGTDTPLGITYIVRCGKCGSCLRLRRRKWEARALVECSRSVRTWNGVLTLTAHQHNYVRAKAAAEFEKQYPKEKPGDFDALPQSVQFAKRHAVICKEITRYLKRVRKQSGVGLRFWLVTEAHKSGLPHYHLLIHETGEARITKAVLEDRWKWGITHWRLVRGLSDSPKAVSYLCKYLSKSTACGIRASRGYGKIDLCHSEVGKLHVKPNDPPTFHYLKATSVAVEESGSERSGTIGCTDPSGTVAVGLQGQLHRYSAMVDDLRSAADARLGGPGSTEAFKKLAAKGHARRDPAEISASKVTHALLGRQPKPTGPFGTIADSEDANEPLPAFVLEGRSTPSKETGER